MLKTQNEKLESIQTKIQQLENQKKRLLQQQKAQGRKDRTKRLCKRAGLLESILPSTIALNDRQFNTFLSKLLPSETCAAFLNEAQTTSEQLDTN
ncbi:MAG: DUF3847 domain-containing protein [Dehalococcoidia bacterium]|nr:DUF3847 domain-containing protein [Dehalococcoidia bacterium]